MQCNLDGCNEIVQLKDLASHYQAPPHNKQRGDESVCPIISCNNSYTTVKGLVHHVTQKHRECFLLSTSNSGENLGI